MNTTPSGIASSWREASSTSPRRVTTRNMSPGSMPSLAIVPRDTLATAVEKIRRFTWQGKSIYPWLRQIAINKVFDVHRQSKRSRRLADAMAHEVKLETDPDSHADAQLMADQERRAHRDRIDDTMQQLQDRYRTAIELRLIQELPREECASRLGVTIGTFDVLLFRAVRAFRKHFGERAPLEQPTPSSGES